MMVYDDIEGLCDKLGGIIENDVCMVDDFPAPGTVEEWQKGASLPWTALDDEYEGSFVVRMKPEDVKKLFYYLPPEDYSKKSLRNLRSRIRNRKAITPPWLEFCKARAYGEPTDKYFTWQGGPEREDRPFKFPGSQGAIIGHEGRHRIEAAILEKLETIPVVIRKRPDEYCYKEWGK